MARKVPGLSRNGQQVARVALIIELTIELDRLRIRIGLEPGGGGGLPYETVEDARCLA